MMEKQNRMVEKSAAGDAGFLDDVVESAAGKMDRVKKPRPRMASVVPSEEPVPCDRVR